MRIGRPLLKLPLRFCGDTLANEVRALPADAWMEHPQKFDGNIAVPLVSRDGGLNNQTRGPMGPTQWLKRCPYILQIMQELNATWGRSRLMALEPGAEVPEHVDIHYYWRTHLRIHIPVITNPDVGFTCNEETVHIAAGECWVLDSFYPHSVVNGGSDRRVHLVLDTVGSGRIWDLIKAANDGATDARLVAPGATNGGPLEFEQVNAPPIMSPWEMKDHIAYMASWTDEQPLRQKILDELDRFVMSWAGTWARYGMSEPGVPHYLRHLEQVRAAIAPLRGRVIMRNGRGLLDSVDRFVFVNAVAPEIVQQMRPGGANFAPARRTA